MALAIGLSLVAAPALAEDQTVTAQPSNTWDKPNVTINVGEQVTWRNAGGIHNVRFDDGSFDMPANPDPTPWTVSRRFEQAGTFTYICEAHPTTMRGRVTAQAEGTVTDTTAPTVSGLEARPATACVRRTRTCRRTRIAFEFTLSEPAIVNGAVRKRGQRTRRFQRNGVQGENAIRFSTRGLAPGRWRLTLTAVDPTGNTSAPARTTFRVRR